MCVDFFQYEEILRNLKKDVSARFSKGLFKSIELEFVWGHAGAIGFFQNSI